MKVVKICPQFFRFWFRYIFPNMSYLEDDAVIKYYGFFAKSGFTKELEKLSREIKDILLFNY